MSFRVHLTLILFFICHRSHNIILLVVWKVNQCGERFFWTKTLIIYDKIAKCKLICDAQTRQPLFILPPELHVSGPSTDLNFNIEAKRSSLNFINIEPNLITWMNPKNLFNIKGSQKRYYPTTEGRLHVYFILLFEI